MTHDLPLKGWKLVDIHDAGPLTPGGACCEYPRCGQPIRWVYQLTHPDVPGQLRVGGRCLASFINPEHAREALEFFKTGWTQRKDYFHKSVVGLKIVVLNRYGTWAVALTNSVRAPKWYYCRSRCESADVAKKKAAALAFRLLQEKQAHPDWVFSVDDDGRKVRHGLPVTRP